MKADEILLRKEKYLTFGISNDENLPTVFRLSLSVHAIIFSYAYPRSKAIFFLN